MRIALLSYRSKEHGGGQGVYVRHLAKGLADLGHDVELLSGQPYPETLDPRVTLTKLPSLDLYREPDPFRTPRLSEFTSWIDVLEYVVTKTGRFSEPLTFSLRAARHLRRYGAGVDVVHDNQGLGYGMLAVQRRLPLVTTIHHPITRDLRVELASAQGWKQRFGLRRFYSFLPMQKRVARRLQVVLGVSSVSADDTAADFGMDRSRIRVVPLGVDTDLFAPPLDGVRVPGRIVAVASADKPLKGVRHLLEAVAKLRTERDDVHLELVCRLEPGGDSERRIAELGLEDVVHPVTGVSDAELAALLASAEVMCVPSMYEGFSLPTVEALASGTPVVASDAGALPEVVGRESGAGVLVPPGDVDALVAALGRVLDDPAERARMGEAGRARALEKFSWIAVARATVETYEAAVALHQEDTRADR
ncbi:glycosyltransferase family 4 protein [Aeromicrobium sp. IC_218]|uniref:glycosyltransferase family 4 protein n=1 Tax=Aeromicrobium sp. IC_218 TaxID=2545468 RepID=UPI00103B909C|nr:glycosyltransferase family 4 protein [Aeromicrobium sp. IC_218]TCI99510.1 glycosyltransferase family 1 protein [Aeromicrobium sp. IC_218]